MSEEELRAEIAELKRRNNDLRLDKERLERRLWSLDVAYRGLERRLLDGDGEQADLR